MVILAMELIVKVRIDVFIAVQVFIAFQASIRDLEYMNAKPSIFDRIQGAGNCDETLS